MMLLQMAKMILLRHVPDSVHRQLKARAARAGLSLSGFLIREVRKVAEQPTPEEMRERLSRLAPYTGKRSPTDVLRGERDA
jgi:antitoxin FitA